MGELEILISCLKKRMEQVNQLTKPSHLANLYNTLMHKCKSLKGYLLTRAHQEILMVEQALSHEIQLTKDCNSLSAKQKRRERDGETNDGLEPSSGNGARVGADTTDVQTEVPRHKQIREGNYRQQLLFETTDIVLRQPTRDNDYRRDSTKRLREQLRSSYVAYQTEMQSSKPCTPSMEEQDHNLRKRRYLN